MESLTKQQVILLALLVSFMSSIATGIVMFSLFDQAPPSIIQTIGKADTSKQSTSTSDLN